MNKAIAILKSDHKILSNSILFISNNSKITKGNKMINKNKIK
jgi:hypothetical protein